MLILCAIGRADPEALLADRDVAKRLEGIQQLVQAAHPEAEKLLLDALNDPDWEVVHRAAEALAVRGTAASIEPLAKLAIRGPIRRIRLAAAASAAKIDRKTATSMLTGRLRGQTALAAADAFAAIPDPAAAGALKKLLKNRDDAVRAAAVAALGALADPANVETFAELLEDEDIRARAAACQALVRVGTRQAMTPLRASLAQETMTSVMERRTIAALRALLLAIKDGEQREFAANLLVRSFGVSPSPLVVARYARLFGSLGRKEAPVGPVAEYTKGLLSIGVKHADPGVRSASVAALGRIGSDVAYEKLAEIAKSDPSERVRFHALRACDAIRGAKAEQIIVDRAEYDRHPMVREEACVLAGRRRLERSARTLTKRLKDESWEVAVAAAISLGKLHEPAGVAPLVEMLAEKDWRRRGGAVVGLGFIRRKEAIEPLIGMLLDKEPAVAASARECLRHATGETLAARPKPWREWWEQRGPSFMFRDRDQEARDAKKYGYAVQPRKVYEGLDIIVLETRRGGDNIQYLLEDYGIKHRTVRAASVAKIGLHPYALFVANCPGEITDKDVERIQWHVRAGGYLFASCWALTHTVEKCFPGVVRKLKTRAQVLDVVAAEPVPSKSPLIKGVFDGITQPQYMLEGSHLIEVIDPERFEVLIDSPECATRWGDGNLAGWFTIGHGLILDSANHFDLQGMVRAKLRNEKERMAFAIDHLGYDYAKVRELQAEGVFAKQPLAIKRTRDLSTFRFITTFVRQKRIADDQ